MRCGLWGLWMQDDFSWNDVALEYDRAPASEVIIGNNHEIIFWTHLISPLVHSNMDCVGTSTPSSITNLCAFCTGCEILKQITVFHCHVILIICTKYADGPPLKYNLSWNFCFTYPSLRYAVEFFLHFDCFLPTKKYYRVMGFYGFWWPSWPCLPE